MNALQKLIAVILFIFIYPTTNAQVDEKKLGSWFMYAFNADLNDSRWGVSRRYSIQRLGYYRRPRTTPSTWWRTLHPKKHQIKIYRRICLRYL